MKDDHPEISAMLEAQAKRRFRPSEMDKARAIALGYKIRTKRGRPPKDEPADVFGGRAARR